MKSPQGTQDSPARSCLDLYLENPSIHDDFYWIDPNGGCIADAVLVFCNFSTEAIKTCVHPVEKESNIQSWSGDSIWLSTFRGGFQLSYTISKSQLQFIRTGSRYASQQFTYNCRNSEASVLFRTQSNKEISPTRVIQDGCQGKPSHLESSVLEVNTKSVEQLPLRDFAATDIGDSNQEFGFTMGPACFY